MSARCILLAICAVTGLSACASSGVFPNTSTGSLAPRMSAGGKYQLSSEELGLKCNKLRGRIQLRILEVRDRAKKSHASIIARSLKWASETTDVTRKASKVIRAGSPQEIAVITAYNERLGQLGCTQYDINAELSPASANAWRIR